MTKVKVVTANGAARIQGVPGRPIFLSGAFGDEVSRLRKERGHGDDNAIVKGTKLVAPLDEAEIVEEVHAGYADLDVDVLTAESFNANVWRQGGDVEFTKRYAAAAAAIATRVSNTRRLVAMSLTSLEDCYRPDLTPDDHVLITEHRKNIEILSPHGDLVLAETLPNVREAEAIAKAAQEAGKPFFVSFTVGEGGHVLDGTPMADVVKTVLEPHSYSMGIGVNCSTVHNAREAVQELGRIFHDKGLFDDGRHIAVYPNGQVRTREENAALAAACACGSDHEDEIYTPEAFAEILQSMVDDGATIVGGCCGTGKEHVGLYTQFVTARDGAQTGSYEMPVHIAPGDPLTGPQYGLGGGQG